ncbi:dehydrogenase/reductase [Xylariomycetidae sp. FL2044]|nr:dehydrogenase/reductase [Xylariomycetidae sp. FL2044]
MTVYTRSAIITGGTLNLGYYAALELARQHSDWLVVVCSRSDKEKAAERINATLRQSNTIFLPLDLSSTQSVRDFARGWIAEADAEAEKGPRPPVQALLLNAALQFTGPTQMTVDGIEATFAISHVGHALLFHLLLSSSCLAPRARVVVTSSGVHDPAMKSGLPDAHYTTAEDLAHPPPAVFHGPSRRHYANAKLANIMWTYALHRRLAERAPRGGGGGGGGGGITVNAFDPGLMPGSGLARDYGAAFRFAWHRVMPRITPLLRLVFTANIHRPSESGASLAWLASGGPADADADETAAGGNYFEGRKEIRSSVESYDKEKWEDLWRWTVAYCARDEDEARRFEQL